MDRKFSLLKTNRKTDKQTDERIPSYFARLKTILFLGFTFLLFLAPMLTDTAWAQNTWNSGIISVSGEETIIGSVDVNGDVSLDIKQGKSLTVNGTIKIGSGSTLTMSNSGSLYVNQSSGSGFQLENGSTLEIKDGSLSINAEAYGIFSDQDVKSSVTVSGGSLTTHGGFMGIALVNSGSSVTVEGGSLTAVGSTSIYSNVTNDIPGTGWTDKAGTGTATAIAAGSYSAADLASYKKVIFKTKIDPIANAPTGITATYGQTLNDVTLTNPAGNTQGTWAWVNGNTGVGDAGSRTFKANFTPADIVTYNTVTGVNVSVNVGKAGQTAPAAPTAANVTVNSVTLNAVAGCEYSRDGNSWQDTPEFTGLAMNTEYTFYQRKKGDDNHNPSDSSRAPISTANHVHNWSYSANGPVITAACQNADGGHSGDTSYTLTLSAGDAVYSGNAYAGAGVTNNITGAAGGTVGSITYYKVDSEGTATGGTVQAGAPTEAGFYYAEVTLTTADSNTYSAVKAFRISPMALTISGASAEDRAYDKDNTAVTISAVWFMDSSGQSVHFTPRTDYIVAGAMSSADAGEDKDVTVTVTLTKTNYSLASNTAATTVNISKAGAQTIADVTGFRLYTLTSVSESVAGKMPADAGTLTYTAGTAVTTGSVAVSGFAVDTNGNVSASLSGGAAGDTVTLPVTITSTNYADSAVNVVITLTAKDDAGVSINGGQDMTVTFGDAGFVPDTAVTDPGTDGTGTWQWKSSEPGIAEIDPDTGNITIRSAGSTTITAAYESDTTLGTASIALTVAPKNISSGVAVTVTGDYVYNASPQEPSGENVSVKLGDTLLAAGTDYTVTAYANNTGAADKSAANAPTVTVTGQGNYIGTASGTFTIAKAVPVIDPLPAAGAVTYGQRLQDSTLTGGAAVLGGTGVPGTFSWKAPDTVPSTSDSGTTEYIVVFTPDDSMNFETAECKVTLTVGSADPGVTPPSAVQGLVYSGSAQVLVKAGSAENGTMLYSLDGGAYSGTLPEQTDAGSRTVRWYVKGNEDHADSGSETEPLGSLSVTIARKAVTVKAEDQSKLAGAAEPELTAVVSGLIGSDTVTYTLTRAEGETAGTYDITPSGLAEQGNYTVTYEKGTLTIRNDSAEDVRQRTVPESLNTVPEGLGFSTVSELEQFLVENLVQLVVDGKPVQTEQTVCLDVKLEISFDGGTSWYPATEKNFPTGGLWVTLPYPEGTGKDTHEFTISHMFTMDSERLGTVKGEVETFGPSEIEKTDQGLRVKLKGLSPVAIGWSAIKPKETVELPVKVEHYRQDGTPGIPDDIPVDTELTLTLKLTGTGGDTIEKKAVMTVQPGERFTNASFFLDEEPAYPEYSFSVAVKPSSVRADIYSSEAAPVKEYSLSAKSVAPENDEESGFRLKVLLQWDDGSGAWKPEEVPVYALPEDEIGAYVLHNDGTKEYLLFQTYDICIYYLGSDELCRGPERCFHKQMGDVNH